MILVEDLSLSLYMIQLITHQVGLWRQGKFHQDNHENSGTIFDAQSCNLRVDDEALSNRGHSVNIDRKFLPTSDETAGTHAL